MSKLFDATMRKLIEMEPAAWLRFLHVLFVDADRVKVIDSNLSTVTADADKVLWVDEPKPGSRRRAYRGPLILSCLIGCIGTALCCGAATKFPCIRRSFCCGLPRTAQS